MDNGGYAMTNPGTPGWQFAPVPGWGINPAAAGPPRVGVGAHPAPIYQAAVNAFGQDTRTATDIETRYKQTSWGVVAASSAAGLLLGVFLGYVAGKKSKGYRRNPSRGGRRKARGYRANVRWSTRYKNQLPDSAFLYVTPGGKKRRTKRGTITIPRSSRKLPYKDLQGRVDRTHLLSAISRAGQKKTKIPAGQKKRIQARAQRIYADKFGYKTASRKLAKAA